MYLVQMGMITSLLKRSLLMSSKIKVLGYNQKAQEAILRFPDINFPFEAEVKTVSHPMIDDNKPIKTVFISADDAVATGHQGVHINLNWLNYEELP